ncbi:dimethylarginine dimethylaminohydrolase family protein [soil metagenome]
MASQSVRYGAQSMVATLHDVLVKAPGPAFVTAYDDPAHGFRHPVDAGTARTEHAAFVSLLARLGVTVHDLDAESASPDLVYQFDPSLVTDRGAVLLRSGKPGRRGEEDLQADWFTEHDIPIAGRVDPPGTVDGGDVCWLASDIVAIGRSLRTNQHGIDQLTALLDAQVHTFDVPYDAGEGECLHLLSVISPITDTLAVVEFARLPSGLYRLLEDLGVAMVGVPPGEVAALACNVLAVRPGLAVLCDGNPQTVDLLEAHDIEVHTFAGTEICWNGSGGPTCLTRPILRH